MSYILDALRRADAERERGAVPGLHAQPLTPVPLRAEDARRFAWAGAAAVAVLVVGGAALGGWWWGGGSAASRPVATQPATAAPKTVEAAATAAPQVAPQPAPRASEAASAGMSPPRAEPAGRLAADTSAQRRPRPARSAPAGDDTATRRNARERTAAADGAGLDAPSPAAPIATRPAAPAASARRPVASAVAADERRVLSLDELPPEIRRSLPALTVSGSIYSDDAASRFVMINGEAVREGGRITPELTLEQIHLKSAVLRYKGYRYRMPL